MVHMDSEEETLHTVSVSAEGGAVLSALQPQPENSLFPHFRLCGKMKVAK